jgi:hypothetical protein
MGDVAQSTDRPISITFRIISGGQTGADRAALDWTIQHGIPHGGWCPRGRRADDGMIPECYHLVQTPTRNYRQRTTWNVRDADATLIISLRKELTGGTLFTAQQAQKLGRPWLHVFPGDHWGKELQQFCNKHQIDTLNVAGPRAASAPAIQDFVHIVLAKFIEIR